MSRSKMLWLSEPEDHDYDAADMYLSLLGAAYFGDVRGILAILKSRQVVWYEAKDILRASGLPLLDKDNEHVQKDLKKIADRQRLSPILLVQGDWKQRTPLIVADGYHRICASWYADENTEVPAKIA